MGMEAWKALAARQHHVISRAQLMDAGISEDGIWGLLRGQTVESKVPGVYRLVGTKRSWQQRLMEACLWGGPQAVASFRSAAALYGLDGFPPGPIEISVRKQRRAATRFKVHRYDVPREQTTVIDGIPVTNAHRLLRDLLPTLPQERADRVLDNALRMGLVSVESLTRLVAAEKGSGHRGLNKMRQLLRQRDPGYRPSASEMNIRIRQVMIAHGITDFVEEYVIVDEEGGFVCRCDFGFPPDWTVVEGQSRAYHEGKADFEQQIDRRSRIAATGHALVEVSWKALIETPEVFIERIRRARVMGRRRAAS